MSRALLFAAVGALFLAGTLGLSAAFQPPYGSAAAEATAEVTAVGDVQVALASAPGQEGALLTVTRGGRELLRLRRHYLALGGDAGEERWLEPGVDVTGDGRPDLVVWGWSGVPGGASTTWIFDLADGCREVARFDEPAPGARGLVDLDGDGVPEFETRDWTFAGWHGYAPGMAAPTVALRLRDGAYRLAPDLQAHAAEPAPLHAEALAADPAWAGGEPPAALVAGVLERIYGGRPDAAWDLLDAAWAGDPAARDLFACDLLGRLSESPYWLELEVSRRTLSASSAR